MIYKYGEMPGSQIAEAKRDLRKRIFFLLIAKENENDEEFVNIELSTVFKNLLTEIDGMNSLFLYPGEIVKAMSLLEAALIELGSESFNFKKYRRLVLEAGSAIEKIKEV